MTPCTFAELWQSGLYQEFRNKEHPAWYEVDKALKPLMLSVVKRFFKCPSYVDDAVQNGWLLILQYCEYAPANFPHFRNWCLCFLKISIVSLSCPSISIIRSPRNSKMKRESVETESLQIDFLSPDSELIQEEDEKRMDDCRQAYDRSFSSLESSERRLIDYRFGSEQLSHRQIAQHLGLSITQVRSNLLSALEHLRRAIEFESSQLNIVL